MAEEEVEASPEQQPKGGGSSKLLMIIVIATLIIGGGGVAFVFMNKDNDEEKNLNTDVSKYVLVEYQVPENIYQLKNGSFLKLSFSIVIREQFLEAVKEILEVSSPARLSNGLNSLLGNKTREDLIGSSLRRENFRMEIKKLLETSVFQEYNRKQRSPKDMIEVREVLLQVFVTQSA